MKKSLMKAGLIVAAAAMMMTGCKSEAKEETTAVVAAEEATKETSEADLTDEASIQVGNYKELSLTTKKTEVNDELIEAQLESLLTQYPAEVTGRAAKLGDVANIDYEGTKDGVAFDGGTAAGYDLTLGSGQFIDGFEDGVVGMNVGEERDINLTFPEEYPTESLAGQEVVFHVTLNALKNAEESAIDDSLAQRVMGDDEATLDMLKSQLYNELTIQAELNFFNQAGLELLNQVISDSEITCDPNAVEKMLEQMKTTYTTYANQFGLTLEDYLMYFMQTDEEGLKTVAENMVQQEMVLNEIIAGESLVATDEQKDAIAQMNYFDDAQDMIDQFGEESAERLFEMGAAYYYLIDNAVEAE